MNQMLKMSAAALEGEAETRLTELFATTRQLRHNLAPEQLFNEAKAAASAKAGTLWQTTEAVAAESPLATLCLAVGAAVFISTSLKSHHGPEKDSNAMMAMTDPGTAPGVTPPVPFFAALRIKIANNLGSIADESFQVVQARYKQKVQDLHNETHNAVREMTEKVLDASERTLTTFFSGYFGDYKTPKS